MQPRLSINNELLPPAYPHLVPTPLVQFWWSRLGAPKGGVITNVWCKFCGDNYEYGGFRDVRAYVWASQHKVCHYEGVTQGEECTRLFR